VVVPASVPDARDEEVGTVAATSATTRPWRLGARGRKLTLLVHIASAGAWLGMDVAMGVLVFTAVRTDDPGTKALCYRALELFAVWPLLSAGLLCLATGILLGLGSKYGLVRYWWVATKLALNLVLSTLVLVALRPGVVELADEARGWEEGEPASLATGTLVFPPIVSTTAVLVAMVLSIFKPWGRLRRSRSERDGADRQDQPAVRGARTS
jgi:uncharacterized membrane protein